MIYICSIDQNSRCSPAFFTHDRYIRVVGRKRDDSPFPRNGQQISLVPGDDVSTSTPDKRLARHIFWAAAKIRILLSAGSDLALSKVCRVHARHVFIAAKPLIPIPPQRTMTAAASAQSSQRPCISRSPKWQTRDLNTRTPETTF